MPLSHFNPEQLFRFSLPHHRHRIHIFPSFNFLSHHPKRIPNNFPITCKQFYVYVECMYYNTKIFHSELTARQFLPPSFSCALGSRHSRTQYIKQEEEKKKAAAATRRFAGFSFGCNKVSWTFTVQYCWAVYTLYMLCNNNIKKIILFPYTVFHSTTCTYNPHCNLSTYPKYMFRIFLILHVK